MLVVKSFWIFTIMQRELGLAIADISLIFICQAPFQVYIQLYTMEHISYTYINMYYYVVHIEYTHKIPLNPQNNPMKYHHFSHFADTETEACRVQVTYRVQGK